MHRGLAASFLLVLAAVAVPPALAGTADEPEVEDDAGDQEVTRTVPSVPMVSDETFDDIDLIAAWFEEPAAAPGNVSLHIRNTAAANAAATFTASFTVARGPTSVFTSTATPEGSEHEVSVTGTAATGISGATATVAECRLAHAEGRIAIRERVDVGTHPAEPANDAA